MPAPRRPSELVPGLGQGLGRGRPQSLGGDPSAPLTRPPCLSLPPPPRHTQAVELRSLWQEQACVVAGLRRFGCMVCRWIAQDLSSLKGLLDQHGVRLVGVGPEALGLQEFLDGGYFAGGAWLPPLSHGAGPQPLLAQSHTRRLRPPLAHSSPCPLQLQPHRVPLRTSLSLRTVWRVPVVILA